MIKPEQLKETLFEYCGAIKLLAINPAGFFEQSKALGSSRLKLLFAAPPVLIFSLAESIIQHNAFIALLCLVSAYAAIAGSAVVLKFVLPIFGQSRSFDETLHITSSAAICFLLAWIPAAGMPLAVVCGALWTVLGLTYRFKMHSSAALTAVALPIVVAGVVGAGLSLIFILLASITRLFG